MNCKNAYSKNIFIFSIFYGFGKRHSEFKFDVTTFNEVLVIVHHKSSCEVVTKPTPQIFIPS